MRSWIDLNRILVLSCLVILSFDIAAAQDRQGPLGQPPQAAPISAEAQLQQMQLINMLQHLEPYRPIGDVQGIATLSGSTTMNDLGQNWAARFKQFHPKVEFKKGADGTENALTELAADPKVIAGVSRPVDEKDLKLLQTGKCKQPLAIVVGLEAMALFVHKNNPLDSISPENLQLLFAAGADGKIKAANWGQLAVQGTIAKQPIHLYTRSAESGTTHYINRILLSGAPAAPPTKTFYSSLEICEAIAKDPAGVGIAGIEGDVADTKPVDLMIKGQRIPANEASILAGKYPLMRPLMLVIDKAQLESDGGLRRAVMRYVLSKDGQMEVIKEGFFPVDPGFNRQQLDQIVGSHSR